MIISGGKIQGTILQDQPGYITTSLVEYLDAQDYTGAGTTWPARVGNAATLYNAPAYTNTGAVYFEFVPSSLQYADAPTLGNLTNWTVECWFRPTESLLSYSDPALVTTIYDDALGTNYGLVNYALTQGSGAGYTQTLLTGYYDGGSWNDTGSWVPETGQWYQMVGTFDGSTIITYVNGAQNSTGSAGGISGSNNAPVRIARRWDGNTYQQHYFPAQISIVRIYNSALTSSQVLQNFTSARGRFGI
jgi:hypothetical protein